MCDSVARQVACLKLGENWGWFCTTYATDAQKLPVMIRSSSWSNQAASFCLAGSHMCNFGLDQFEKQAGSENQHAALEDCVLSAFVLSDSEGKQIKTQQRQTPAGLLSGFVVFLPISPTWTQSHLLLSLTKLMPSAEVGLVAAATAAAAALWTHF